MVFLGGPCLRSPSKSLDLLGPFAAVWLFNFAPKS